MFELKKGMNVDISEKLIIFEHRCSNTESLPKFNPSAEKYEPRDEAKHFNKNKGIVALFTNIKPAMEKKEIKFVRTPF